MTIVWNSTLNTGIDVIDSQHRRIVSYINALEEARAAKDRTRVGHIIEQLVDYTQSHFGFEESLMEEAGYRFLKPHQKVHELFIKRVNSFTVRAAKGEDISDELHTMLSTWLLNHIAHEDRDYAASVKRMADAEERTQPAPVVQAKRKSLLRQFFGLGN
ncbi:MAG TPA: bacteriohemerythrin [Burkholderiaceae bacterium]|nr:bacteriohemerythrin [Burkholderiaceae bacterium]